MSRAKLLTQKVKTDYGSMYVHAELGQDGRVVGVSFSTPGKILDSELDNVIRLMGEETDKLIREADTLREARGK